jgi:5,5'-dehydrodivanillate O-demethylase
MALIDAMPGTTSETSMSAEWTDFAHTGPGTLAGRYLRRFWHPVFRADDLPVGRAKPLRIMSEDFTLYRGESGIPHCVAFRCAHRGTQLSTGWVEGDNLRCFYHGWKYGPDGQCVEQPAEPEPFCRRIRIKSYPTQEYLGLIFAYLGEGAPPEFPRYPDFEGEGIREVGTYLRRCNYFNNIENQLDPAHTAFVHREPGAPIGSSVGGLEGIPMMTGEVSAWGITMRGTRPSGKVRINQYGMPNILHIQSGPGGGTNGRDALAWRVPVDDENHRSFNINLVHVTGEAAERYQERRTAQAAAYPGDPQELTEAILRGDRHIDEMKGRPDIVNIQDNVAQMGQGAIPDPAIEHLGRSDVLVVLLRKVWAEELRAVAEGRPTQPWNRLPHIVAVHGS